MNIWTEFRNSILPWLLAGLVVAFLIAEHRRTTAALLEANTRLANAVEQQGRHSKVCARCWRRRGTPCPL
jgi:hypothetical protein